MGWAAQRGEGPSLLQVSAHVPSEALPSRGHNEKQGPQGTEVAHPLLRALETLLKSTPCAYLLQPGGTFSVLLPQLEGPSGSPVGLSARRRQGD